MDVNKATIVFIGEIQSKLNKPKTMIIDVITASSPKTRYIIYENKNHSFDIIRHFEEKYIQVGDMFDFDYNPSKNWLPNIWRFANHKKINKYYIDYRDSKDSYKAKRKYFDSHNEAMDWMIKTFDKEKVDGSIINIK